MTRTPSKNPFSYAGDAASPWKRAVVRGVEATARLGRAGAAYHARVGAGGVSPWGAAAEALGVSARVSGATAEVPRTGACVFVANHPYGVVDGVLLGEVTGRFRNDGIVIAHKALAEVAGFEGCVLPVDFSDTPDGLRTNLATRAAARGHLAAGGAVGVFPGGGVATARTAFGPVEELPWGPFAASLILGSGATAVPVRFAGGNGRAFQIASRFSRTLRLGLLARETRRQRGREIGVVVGRPISYRGRSAARRDDVTDELRTAVAALATAGLPERKAR